jgi:hypothetical protein
LRRTGSLPDRGRCSIQREDYYDPISKRMFAESHIVIGSLQAANSPVISCESWDTIAAQSLSKNTRAMINFWTAVRTNFP